MRTTSLLSAIALCCLAGSAHADTLAGWTFENGTGNGIVTSNADTTALYLSNAFVKTTADGTVENLNGDNGSNPYTNVLPGRAILTRHFGRSFVYATFTTATAINLTGVDFGAQHNHNTAATSGGYSVQLGLASGAYSTAATFANFGASVALPSSINNKYHMLSVASSTTLAAGTYTLRWSPTGLGGTLTETGGDYFALGEMRMTGTQAVPEPGTLAVLGLGTLAALRRRRKA